MNTPHPISQEDLALFALQLLPEDEARIVREHLRENASSRAELGALQADLSLYALGTEMAQPSAASRERLLRRVSEEKQEKRVASSAPSASSGSESKPLTERAQDDNVTEPTGAGRAGNVVPFPWKNAASRPHHNVITWGGWAVAAGFALAVALQFHQHRQLQGELDTAHAQLYSLQDRAAASQSELSALTDPTALSVSLQQPAAPGAELARTPAGHAAYLPDRGALVFVATDLQPLKPYKVYELWLLPAEKSQAPVPAASFRPDAAGNANVVLPTGPKLLSVGGFGVTVEDDNSPHRKPTLPILLMGTSKA